MLYWQKEHLLWRPDSKNVTKIFLHIGTNNLSSKKSIDVAGCIQVMNILKKKYSNADITFVSLYPHSNIIPEKNM